MEVSQAYQAFWQQIGVEVNLDSKEQSAHITQGLGLESDPPLSGDYDVQCWRLGADTDPYTTWKNSFGPWETEVLNVTNSDVANSSEFAVELKLGSRLTLALKVGEERVAGLLLRSSNREDLESASDSLLNVF